MQQLVKQDCIEAEQRIIVYWELDVWIHKTKLSVKHVCREDIFSLVPSFVFRITRIKVPVQIEPLHCLPAYMFYWELCFPDHKNQGTNANRSFLLPPCRYVVLRALFYGIKKSFQDKSVHAVNHGFGSKRNVWLQTADMLPPCRYVVLRALFYGIKKSFQDKSVHAVNHGFDSKRNVWLLAVFQSFP